MKKIAYTLLGFGIIFMIVSFWFYGMPYEAVKIPEFLALGCIFASGMLFMISADAN